MFREYIVCRDSTRHCQSVYDKLRLLSEQKNAHTPHTIGQKLHRSELKHTKKDPFCSGKLD